MPDDQDSRIRRIQQPSELGEVVRLARERSGANQATAAGISGVGVRFLGDVERGKPTIRFALVLQVLHRLGLELWIAPRGWRPKDS